MDERLDAGIPPEKPHCLHSSQLGKEQLDTLRDQFAIEIAKTLIKQYPEYSNEAIAKETYNYVDALMTERENRR